MAEKAARNSIQQRIESQLWYAVREQKFGRAISGARGLRSRLAVPVGDRVLVDLTASVTPGLIREVSRVGGKVVNGYPEHRSVRAEIPLAAVEAIAAQPGVTSVRSADGYQLNSLDTLMEGVVVHRVAEAQQRFSATGSGIKIGVLSDSVDYLADLQSKGLLPPVNILPGQGGSGTGEGTAMLHIIHAMAPGAQLYFATAMGGVAAFANNIRALRNAGCQIIVDDVLYFAESPFQDGPVAQAVNQVAASGALYFAAAGNAGSPLRNTGSTWEGDFKDAGPATLGRGGRLHDFGGTNANAILPGVAQGRMDLFWADPLGKAENDYDVYVLDAAGSVVAASTDLQNGTQDPWEKLGNVSPGQRIVIVRFAGKDRYLHLSAGRAYLRLSTPGAVRGHNAPNTPNAFGVAAARLPSPLGAFGPAPANPTEGYSSDGPRRIFFHPDGTPITPNNFSSTGGALLMKPDLTAAAGVTTAVPGFAPFQGTSAAAPHAAALAGLVWSHRPNLTASEVAQVLTATALDIDAPGVDPLSGAGVLMGYEALSYDLPLLAIQQVELLDDNGSGTLDPNECGDLRITLVNQAAPGRQTALDLTGVLATSVAGLRIDPAPRSFGDLPADGQTTSTATFRVSSTQAYPCGTRIPLHLDLQMSNPHTTELPFYLDPLAAGFGAPVRSVADGLPQPVPDPGTVESTLQVASFDRPVAKVRVGLHLTHPYITDLKILLQGPDGTQAVLTLNQGASGNPLGLSCDEVVVFSDEATRSLATASPPYVGEFRPQQPLAAFVGKTGSGANGAWTLRVQDQFAPDSGVLQCWWLELSPNTCGTGSGACLVPPTFTQAPANLTVTNGNTALLSALVQGTEPLTYRWYFNATNLLNVPNSPTLQLVNVSSAEEGLYSLVAQNPYGFITTTARLSVVVRPTIACAAERSVPIGGAWDLIPPQATGTNVVVHLLSTVTNAAACGPSHTVLFGWEAVDDGGFTAVCTQTVNFVDLTPPQIACLPQKIAAVGDVWSFDMPTAVDPGDAPVVAYDSVSGASVGTAEALTGEQGDEITLEASGSIPVRFTLSYVGTNHLAASFAGTPAAQVRFYLNDGPELEGGLASPGTLLFDSGPQTLPQYGDGSLTVAPYDPGAAVPLSQSLPQRFTWTVQFSGLGDGDAAWLPLRGPGGVGETAPWYWQRLGDSWVPATNAAAGRFAAELSTRNYALSVAVIGTVTNNGCGAGYQVTRTWRATDACGNTADCSQTIDVLDPTPPVIATEPEGLEVRENDTASFSVTASGCGPFTYQWFKDATNLLSGAASHTLELPNVRATDAGDYTVVVSTPFASVTSAVARLTVLVPAQIVGQPEDVDAGEGDTVRFSVLAEGTAPLAYFWYFNQTNLLADRNGPDLELPTVTPAQAGLYSVVVSNAFGLEESRLARLRLLYPPVFQVALTNQVATNGGTVTFAVSALGSQPLAYEWLFNETNLLATATNGTLLLSQVTSADEGLYRVTVRNAHGEISSSARLTVVELPSIVSGPASLALNPGETASFTVAAAGTAPLTYQWYGADGNPLPDETNSTLVIPEVTAAQGGVYTVAVTNPYGSVSANAELRILGFPVIVAGPQDVTATSGDFVRLTVRAQGSDPLTYHWFKDGALMAGMDRPELLFDPITPAHAGVYRVLVSNPLASSMSEPALVKVIAPAVILQQPTDLIVTNGAPALFSATVEGQPPISLQWYFNETNLIAGATTASLLIPEARPEHIGAYTLLVSNLYNVITSTPAHLMVVTPLHFVRQPVSQAVNRGQPVAFSVQVEGSGPISFQWFRDGDQPIAGANADQFALVSAQLADAGSYYVVVSSPYETIASVPAQLLVIAPPEVLGPSSIVATNGNDVTFVVEATGTPPLLYQWYFNDEPLVDATNAVLSLDNVEVAQAGTYAVAVTNPYGAVTNSARLTVLVELNLVCPPARTIELGQDWDFAGPEANGLNVVVSVVQTTTNQACGGTFTAARTWEARDASNDFLQCVETVQVVDTAPPIVEPPVSRTVVLGEGWSFDEPTGTDLGGIVAVTVVSTVTNSTCAGGFEAVRTWDLADPCGNATRVSQTVTVEDRSAPVVTAPPEDQEVLEGANVLFAVSVTACPPITYQWYLNQTNVLPFATNASLALDGVTEADAGDYSVSIRNAYGEVVSGPAQLVVRVPAQIISGPAPVSVLEGQEAVFSAITRGTEPVSLQWFIGETQPIPGATGPTLTLSQVTPAQAGTYSLLASNAWGTMRKSAFLDVFTAPQITAEPQDFAVPVGGTAAFSVGASGNPAPQYQWYFNGNTLLPGATGPTLTILDAHAEQAGDYAVFVSNPVGGVWSRTARLTLTEAPVIVAPPQSVTVARGTTVEFRATAAGAPPLTYQWYFQATNLISGATGPSLTLPNVDVVHSGVYTLEVANNSGRVVSPPATLRVLVAPTVTGITKSNGLVTLTLTTETNLLYSVYYATNLGSSSVWTVLPKAIRRLGTGLPMKVEDSQASDPHRVYRVLVE